MVNQLGMFSPHMADLGQLLRELLSPPNAWMWGPEHEWGLLQCQERAYLTHCVGFI